MLLGLCKEIVKLSYGIKYSSDEVTAILVAHSSLVIP